MSLNDGRRGWRRPRRQLWIGIWIGLRCGDGIERRIRARLRSSKRRYGRVESWNRAKEKRDERLEKGAADGSHEFMDATCRVRCWSALIPTAHSPAGLPASLVSRAAKAPLPSEPPDNPATGAPRVRSARQRRRRGSTQSISPEAMPLRKESQTQTPPTERPELPDCESGRQVCATRPS